MDHSRKEFFELIQSRIDHQRELINQRLSWMTAAEAFLFTGYTIVVTTTPGSLENFAPEIWRLDHVIPLLGYFIAGLTVWSVMRALDATEELKRFYLDRAEILPPDQFLPLIDFEAPEAKIKWIARCGRNIPFLFAMLFVVGWLLVTSARPKPPKFWNSPRTVEQQILPVRICS